MIKYMLPCLSNGLLAIFPFDQDDVLAVLLEPGISRSVAHAGIV